LQACVDWDNPPADVLSVTSRSRGLQGVVIPVFKALGGESVCTTIFLVQSLGSGKQRTIEGRRRLEKSLA